MKYLSVFFLVIYMSITVFPSVGKVFDLDVPEIATSTGDEKESEEASFNFTDFIPSESLLFLQNNNRKFISQKAISFEETDDSIHLSPYLTIFSPPPEA